MVTKKINYSSKLYLFMKAIKKITFQRDGNKKNQLFIQTLFIYESH